MCVNKYYSSSSEKPCGLNGKFTGNLLEIKKIVIRYKATIFKFLAKSLNDSNSKRYKIARVVKIC